jgi:hypothetical protein
MVPGGRVAGAEFAESVDDGAASQCCAGRRTAGVGRSGAAIEPGGPAT